MPGGKSLRTAPKSSPASKKPAPKKTAKAAPAKKKKPAAKRPLLANGGKKS